jgi:DNA primase
VRGKTLASVYSVRANEFAGVSTPLTWDEVDAEIDPRDFTLGTFAARLESSGDLWADLQRSKGANLRFSETPAPRGRGRALAK